MKCKFCGDLKALTAKDFTIPCPACGENILKPVFGVCNFCDKPVKDVLVCITYYREYARDVPMPVLFDLPCCYPCMDKKIANFAMSYFMENVLTEFNHFNGTIVYWYALFETQFNNRLIFKGSIDLKG